ncbi:MAG: PorP/SprF family type IX secretion system membrane protein [Chitinophagales bacterium]|nr:PorP/SprF family type IX secretion system membrane protein [Chitinophagales bacterium]
MRKILLALMMFHVVTPLWAQVSPQFSNYMFFRQAYNPAVAGSENYVDMTALYRAQWVNINGAPSVAGLSVHAPIKSISSGIGFTFYNEMTGEQRLTMGNVNFAYGHSFRFGRLSAGIGLGLYQRALNGDKLIAPEGNYESGGVNHNDNYIPNTKVSAWTPELSTGLYFNNDRLYLGVGVMNLLQMKSTLAAPGGEAQIRATRTLAFMGGYRISVGKKFFLLPSVMVKTEFKNYQSDVTLLLQYKDNIYGGFSFRGSSSKTKDALVAMLGFRIVKGLNVGYSYDFSLSALNNANSGSHEAFINYRLPLRDKSKPGKIIYNPRNL